MEQTEPLSLLCLPCAGASATMYLRWRRLLPRWIELVPVELPGRGARLAERFASGYEPLIEQLCAEQAGAMQGRFALFGHSMGALLAYGIAQRRRSLGLALPCVLFASGSPAPSRRDPGRFAAGLDDVSLVADLRKQGGTPEDLFAHADLLRMTLDVLRADYRICASFQYRCATPLQVPIHAFGGRSDDIGAEQLDAWSMETHAGFALDWFDGGHFFIRQQEVRAIAVLRESLDGLISMTK